MTRPFVRNWLALTLLLSPEIAGAAPVSEPSATLKVSIVHPETFMFTVGEIDLKKCKLRKAFGYTNKKGEGAVFPISAGQVAFQIYVDTHLTGAEWVGLFMALESTVARRETRRPPTPAWPIFYAEPGAQYEVLLKPSLDNTQISVFRTDGGKKTPVPWTVLSWKTGAFRLKMMCPK